MNTIYYILGYIRWIRKPSNDKAFLTSCIDYYKFKMNTHLLVKHPALEAKEELSDRSLSDFLDYEIRSSWWAPYIGWGWLQEICGKYFARKTKRKFERYQTSMEWGQIIEKSQTK